MWGIKKDGLLLGVGYYSNDGAEFCNAVSFQFEEYPSPITYLVENREDAEYALATNTPWYNASYEHPQHMHDMTGCEIVEVELVIKGG